MKIDYKKYPILEKLEKGKLGVLPIYNGDKDFFLSSNSFSDYWYLFKNDFKKEINVISKPFEYASLNAKTKLMPLFLDIMYNRADDFLLDGTFLICDYVCMVYLKKEYNKEKELAFFIFQNTGAPVGCLLTDLNGEEYSWVTKASIFKSKEEKHKWINLFFIHVVLIGMFKTYASVETKILLPKQKIKNIGCKYKNETNLKLNFLDSKWFTNLVKSNEFLVSGHFRLQPKKINGKWTKELIWISEFKKTGYTAPARMLSRKDISTHN
jgi:hypothetical protein